MLLSMPNEIFEKYAKIIKERSGIIFDLDKKYLIESKVVHLLTKYKIYDYEEFLNFMVNHTDDTIYEELIDEITINETLWFRDKVFVELFTTVVMPDAIEKLRSGKPFYKIWSSACSTGQEPYSINIMIKEYLYNRNIKDIDLSRFQIIASDISTSCLEIAMSGSYDRISMNRGMTKEIKEKYFIEYERYCLIKEEYKSNIKFKKINLMNDFKMLGNFDIILCRYVLIYFEKLDREKILIKMNNMLEKEGIILLGGGEIFTDSNEIFERVKLDNGNYFRKRSDFNE